MATPFTCCCVSKTQNVVFYGHQKASNALGYCMLCHCKQLFVCSVLGKALLPSLDYAAERLIAPGARVVPAAVQVSCMQPLMLITMY